MTKIDFNALGAQAAADGKDMTKAQTGGGGDYVPPAPGPCRLRFVAYVELGKHKVVTVGKTKVQDRVQLVFEVSGPKHPAKVTESGEKIPARITITENLSLNEKANFFKLFTRMNYAGGAKHMAQLLGKAYLGTIVHDNWTGKDGKPQISAKLRDEQGYTIRPPQVEDIETGEYRTVPVDEPISALRCFIWDHADMDQWNSLFIDGEYPERKNDKGEVTAPAKSKNVLQDAVRTAENFKGSKIDTLLGNGGKDLDLPAPESGRAALDADGEEDPLAGVA